MKVTCKNTLCRHYYDLAKGMHCPVEETCPHYTRNKRKADKKRIRCKECEYCKKIYTNGMKEYHYECTAYGQRRIILMVEERVCDCRKRSSGQK